MNNIEWKDGAVCYADGMQWYAKSRNEVALVNAYAQHSPFDGIFYGDLQLNEIRIGDYIEASELDTEQKYNDVVEVFGLFGVTGGLTKKCADYDNFKSVSMNPIAKGVIHKALHNYCFGVITSEFDHFCNRQLTYNQIIAIGKLKRMMIEREKSAVKYTHEIAPDFPKVSANKYEREITDRQGNTATVDVYDVLKAFEVACPATQHAVKKLLCSGLMGHKDIQTDLIEAKESIARAIELN